MPPSPLAYPQWSSDCLYGMPTLLLECTQWQETSNMGFHHRPETCIYFSPFVEWCLKTSFIQCTHQSVDVKHSTMTWSKTIAYRYANIKCVLPTWCVSCTHCYANVNRQQVTSGESCLNLMWRVRNLQDTVANRMKLKPSHASTNVECVYPIREIGLCHEELIRASMNGCGMWA